MRFEPAVLLLSVLAACASAPKYSLAPDSGSIPRSGALEVASHSALRLDADPSLQTQFAPPSQQPPPQSGRPEWEKGKLLMQGVFGVSEFDKIERDGGTTATVDGDAGTLDDMPVFGGGVQQKLGGDRIDIGLEGLFSFGGRANAAAFAVGGGGAAIAVDVDLLLFDMYGGPFVSMFLGENLRVYGGLGPLVQWAIYDQSSANIDADGSGFGFGTYARAGVEFMLPSRTLLGFCTRWSDSTVDLSNDLGDLEMEGVQFLITVSRGL